MSQSMPMYMPFNPMDYDPSQSAGQLPVGQHIVVVTGAEVKATKECTGGYLQLFLKVVQGESMGATGAWNLNLYNNSVKAVEIANKQMSALCYAIGVFAVINDASQLFDKPFMVEVGQQKENPQYTEIKKILTVNGQDPKTVNPNAPQQQVQQPQQPVNTGFGGQAQQPPQNPSGFGGQAAGGFGGQAQGSFGGPRQPEQPAQNAQGFGGGFGGQPAQNGFGNQPQQPQQNGFGAGAQGTGFGGQAQQPAWRQ